MNLYKWVGRIALFASSMALLMGTALLFGEGSGISMLFTTSYAGCMLLLSLVLVRFRELQYLLEEWKNNEPTPLDVLDGNFNPKEQTSSPLLLEQGVSFWTHVVNILGSLLIGCCGVLVMLFLRNSELFVWVSLGAMLYASYWLVLGTIILFE